MVQSDPFAIAVSAPGIGDGSHEQAQLSECLANTKIDHESEVVSSTRASRAQRNLTPRMRVFFHQGGAPSRCAREFPRAGCLIAAGYFDSIHPLGRGHPPPGVPSELWQTETVIFALRGKQFTHFIKYRGVQRISARILTKEIIGHPPRSGDNFIVVRSQDQGYAKLDELWRCVMR